MRATHTDLPPVAGSPPEDATLEPAIQFTMEFGAALHRFGVPAHRLEPMLADAARSLGLEAVFFVEPTSLQAAFERPGYSPQARFARVEPGSEDLERLVGLDQLGRSLEARSDDPSAGGARLAAAQRELARILAAPGRYPAALDCAAHGIASATAARFFGGGSIEIALGLMAGVLVGVLNHAARRHPRVLPIFEGGAAFATALMTHALIAAGVPASADITVLAGLIVLVPGLSLTLAVTELATRHLASGVARLAAAMVSFGAIGFGVVLAQRVAAHAFGTGPTVSTPVAWPDWTLWPSLVLASMSFGIVFRAHPRDAVPIAIAAMLAFTGARLGALALGPELGAFGGAALLAMTSNAWARASARPATVTLLPGLLLLVPGSIGFRSLSSLLDHDVEHGMHGVVQMITVAMALVGGLLVANVLLPSRRAL